MTLLEELQEHCPQAEYEVVYDPTMFDFEITRLSDKVSVKLRKESAYMVKAEDLPDYISELFSEAEDAQEQAEG